MKAHCWKGTLLETFRLTLKKRWLIAKGQRAVMCRCPIRRDKVAKARSGPLILSNVFAQSASLLVGNVVHPEISRAL